MRASGAGERMLKTSSKISIKDPFVRISEETRRTVLFVTLEKDPFALNTNEMRA